MPDQTIRSERVSTRARASACIGYALLSFSCQLTVWGGLELTARTGLALLPLLVWWAVPLVGALGITLIMVGVFTYFHPSGALLKTQEHETKKALIPCFACVVVLIGYGLVVVGSPVSSWYVGAGAAILGVGLGVLFVSWASVFTRFDVRDATTLVLIALVVCAVLSLVAEVLSLVVLELVFICSTCVSVVLLLVSRQLIRTEVAPRSVVYAPEELVDAKKQPRTARELLKSVLKAIGNPLFCAAAIAFAVAITRTMTLSTKPDAVGVLGALCMAVGSGVLLVVMRGRWGRRASQVTIPLLFRIMFPLVATLLLVLSIGGEKFEQMASAAVFALYAIMFALIIPASVDSARREGSPAVAVYGVFAGIVYVVFAGATLLGTWLFAEGGGFGATTSLVATLLVLYVLAMAYALVQRRATASEGAAESGGGTAVPTTPSELDDLPDPIERRCLVLSEQFALSPRETDVLVAFAHGRNVSYLAEQLYLSPNTIRSHSKTLYTKLGVHSKQELLNLVEEVETSPTA